MQPTGLGALWSASVVAGISGDVDGEQQCGQQPLETPSEPRGVEHTNQVVSEKSAAVGSFSGEAPQVILERRQRADAV